MPDLVLSIFHTELTELHNSMAYEFLLLVLQRRNFKLSKVFDNLRKVTTIIRTEIDLALQFQEANCENMLVFSRCFFSLQSKYNASISEGLWIS